VLLCFSVPPFKRQAAGPLTENLPNVLVYGPENIGCQLSSPVVRAKQANVLPYEKEKQLCVSRLIFCGVSAVRFLVSDLAEIGVRRGGLRPTTEGRDARARS